MYYGYDIYEKHKMAKKVNSAQGSKNVLFFFCQVCLRLSESRNLLFTNFAQREILLLFVTKSIFEFLAQISIMTHSCAFCNGWQTVQPWKIQPQSSTLTFSTHCDTLRLILLILLCMYMHR